MSNDFDLVRGSGNVFRDFDQPEDDLEQLRAILAAQILGVMGERHLPDSKLAEVTGIDAADFSCIRKANLDRFTVDCLRTILGKLDQLAQVSVTRTSSGPGASSG